MASHPYSGAQSPLPEPDRFVFLAKEKEIVQTLHGELMSVIQVCCPEVDALVEAIELQGVPVIRQQNSFQAKIFFRLLGGGELGFIPPTMPKYPELVALIQNLAPEKAHLDFSSGVILTLPESDTFPTLVYQWAHARAFQRGLSGYQHEARRLFARFTRKYKGQLTPKFLETLDIEEAEGLRSAIRREREALQFLRKVLHEVIIPSNNARRLDEGTAQA